MVTENLPKCQSCDRNTVLHSKASLCGLCFLKSIDGNVGRDESPPPIKDGGNQPRSFTA